MSILHKKVLFFFDEGILLGFYVYQIEFLLFFGGDFFGNIACKWKSQADFPTTAIIGFVTTFFGLHIERCARRAIRRD